MSQGYVIVEFTEGDCGVSAVPVSWLVKVGGDLKCYWPPKDAVAAMRKQKSVRGDWKQLSCRRVNGDRSKIYPAYDDRLMDRVEKAMYTSNIDSSSVSSDEGINENDRSHSSKKRLGKGKGTKRKHDTQSQASTSTPKRTQEKYDVLPLPSPPGVLTSCSVLQPIAQNVPLPLQSTAPLSLNSTVIQASPIPITTNKPICCASVEHLSEDPSQSIHATSLLTPAGVSTNAPTPFRPETKIETSTTVTANLEPTVLFPSADIHSYNPIPTTDVSSAINPSSTSFMELLTAPCVCGELKQKLESLAASVAEIKDSQEKIILLLDKIHAQPSNEFEIDIFQLPVSSDTDMMQLTRDLQDKAKRRFLKQYLSRRGGKGVQQMVRKMMNECITYPMASKYTLYGRSKEKKAFSELPLCRLIIQACLLGDRKLKQEEVIEELQNFLKHAPEKPDCYRYKPTKKEVQRPVHQISDIAVSSDTDSEGSR